MWVLLRLAPGALNRAIIRATRTTTAEDTASRLTAAEELKRRRTLEALGGTLARIAVVVLAALAVLGVLSVVSAR